MDFWGWLTNGWNSFTTWVSDAWDWAAGAATTVVTAIADAVTWVVDGVGDAVNWVVDTVGDGINWVVEGIETVAETILPFAQPFIEGVSDAVQGAVTAVTDTVSTIAELATDTVSAVVDGVASVVTTGISIAHDFGEKVFTDPIGAIATAVTDVVEGIAGLFPDPSSPDNPGWGFFTHIYDTLAKTLIEFPTKLTENIPFLNYVGNLVSDVVSFVLKDVGIVADHFLMWGGQVVDLVENLVVGAVNIADKLFKDPASIWSDGDSSGSPDSVMDVINNIFSYLVNSTKHHLFHDVELLASPIDLLIQLAKTTEKALGIQLPGLSTVDDAWDWLVSGVQNGLITVVDGAGQIGEWIGLEVNGNGSGPHVDHVGEGDIHGNHGGHGGHGETGGNGGHGGNGETGGNGGHGGNGETGGNGGHGGNCETGETGGNAGHGGNGSNGETCETGETGGNAGNGGHGSNGETCETGGSAGHGGNGETGGHGQTGEHGEDDDACGCEEDVATDPAPVPVENNCTAELAHGSVAVDQAANETANVTTGDAAVCDVYVDGTGHEAAQGNGTASTGHGSIVNGPVTSLDYVGDIGFVIPGESDNGTASTGHGSIVNGPVTSLDYVGDIGFAILGDAANDTGSTGQDAMALDASQVTSMPNFAYVCTIESVVSDKESSDQDAYIASELVLDRVEIGDVALISAIDDLGPAQETAEIEATVSKGMENVQYYTMPHGIVDVKYAAIC